MKTLLISTTALAALFVLGSSALAQATGSAAPAKANFCGTVVKLTEDHCIGVHNSMPVVTYDITGAKRQPDVGWTVQGHGTVDTAPNICMEGTRLKDVSWKRVDACPLK